MKEYENINVEKEQAEDGLDFRVIFDYLRAYWWLFVLSVMVCVAGAVAYLHYATPVYNVSAKVLLQDSQKGGSISSPADVLADFGMQSKASNVENEIALMSSMTVVRRAVAETNLYTRYLWGEDSVLYKETTPLTVAYDDEAMAALPKPVKVELAIADNGEVTSVYEIDEVKSPAVVASTLPFVLNTPFGDMTVSRNNDAELTAGVVTVSVAPIAAVAASYQKALGIFPLSKTASVANMSYNTPDPAEGAIFLNAVIESYNNVVNETKRQVACRTEEFISSRLVSLKKELEEMEGSLAAYKKQNELVDPKSDATEVIKKRAEYTKLLEELDLKLTASKYMNDFVNDSKNEMQVIPASFGTDLDPALTSLINNYNAKVIERMALQQSTTAENPVLRTSTKVLESMLGDLRTALAALDQSLTIERKAISILADKYNGRFELSPEVERQLLSIKRECDIKSGLYVMLLQKYEETLLSIEVQSDNLSCIDAPYCTGKVAPNKKMILLIALFLGLMLPAAYIYICVLVRNKFDSVAEIRDVVKLPFLGSIPTKTIAKAESAGQIVVKKNKNDIMAEAFRSLRTNLEFVMRKTNGKVILFTSTVSGEGKTFVASNLAVSTALLGKKVLLIGCDIRRPRLAEVFGFDKSKPGFTSYLAANENELSLLDKYIVSSTVEGLDVLPAGIVPPNPAELLSGNNFDRAIEYLRGKYDYIILDGPPVGLVSDSMIINRVADVVAYVMRVGYTHKTDADFVKTIVKEKKLENVSIVVNADNLQKKAYRSYGGTRYSTYGYSENL